MTTTGTTDGRPKWPYPEQFIEVDGRRHYARMSAHPNGQWVKKIPGTQRLWYGGVVGDPEAALQRFRDEWPSIVRGDTVTSQAPSDALLTVRHLGNLWHHAKATLAASGELSPHTLRKYRWVGQTFGRCVGMKRPVASLGPRDFLKFRKHIGRYTVTGRSDLIANVRGMFRWAVRAGLLEAEPVYGPEFVQPSKAVRRRARHENGSRVIPADHIRYMLVHADVHLRPVILLGINAGLKSLEIATLGTDTLDLERGVIDGLRRKRWTPMYAPLWPQTVRAIREAACPSGPLLQYQGRLPWNGKGTDRVGRSFKPMCEALGLPAYTHGQLRHTLRTIGGEVDYRGVRRVMGHSAGDVLDETYDHGKLEASARRVVDAVRWWLFTNP